MFLEATIIERVETYIRHPVFTGSDEVMRDVLEDLDDKAVARQISEDTHRRLRALILRSPHFRAG